MSLESLSAKLNGYGQAETSRLYRMVRLYVSYKREAALDLDKLGISIEIIDAQCLHPFDRKHLCSQSLQQTNRLLVVDEDFPGGASAFITHQVLEIQKGYYYLDGQPRTLTAKAHRPPYGSDGDYFTKPAVDDVVEVAYAIMSESNPNKFPPLYEGS